MADFPLGVVPPALTGLAASPLFGLREDTPKDLSGANGATTVLGFDSGGSARITHEGGNPVFIANSAFACDSTGTDIFFLPGNALCIIKVLWLMFSSVATTAITARMAAILRAAVDTAGTAVASNLTAYDQRDGTAGVPNSVPKHYTVHPTSLGAAINGGPIVSQQYYQGPAASATIAPSTVIWNFRDTYGSKGLRLAGATQVLCLNAAAALGGSGNLWDVTCAFQELPLTA